MFVVVQVGSSQYLVQEKDEILVDKLNLEEGKNFMIDKVLLVAEEDGKKVQIGTPYLDNIKVETRVIGEEKGKKVLVFKMKAKKRYQKTRGHRSFYTRLKVLKVSVLSGTAKAKKVEKVEEKPAKKKAPVKKTTVKKPAAKKAGKKPAPKAEA